MRRNRAAFTLIELMIVLAMIGIIGMIVTLAFRVPVMTVGEGDVAQTLIARRTAFREGRVVTVDIVGDSGVRTASLFPDGMIVADSQIPLGRVDVLEPKRRQ